MTAGQRSVVVLVPGLFMGKWALVPLRRRIMDCGFDVYCFSYPTVGSTCRENAARLNRYLRDMVSPVVHFVCHSLGGLVVRHLFHTSEQQRPGRVITLGTPHQGSRVAVKLGYLPGFKALLAAGLSEGLAGGAPPWPGGRQLAVISGTKPFGLGMTVCRLSAPHDGTVTVAETKLEGMSAHALLPVTHTGLLVSPMVARFVCAYLKAGRFPRLDEVAGSMPRSSPRG